MATTYSPRIVTDGLILALDVGNYKSYPETGTTCYDIVKKNVGSLIGGVTYVDGYFLLDGINGYINFPNIGNVYNIGIGDYTMSAWIYPLNFSNYQHIISFDNQNNFSFKAAITTGHLYFYGGTEYRSFVDSFGTWKLILNEWQQITLSRDGNNHYAYFNGEYIGTYVETVKSLLSANIVIGWGNGGEYVAQRRGLVKIYNRILSNDEVLQNYNALKHRFK